MYVPSLKQKALSLPCSRFFSRPKMEEKKKTGLRPRARHLYHHAHSKPVRPFLAKDDALCLALACFLAATGNKPGGFPVRCGGGDGPLRRETPGRQLVRAGGRADVRSLLGVTSRMRGKGKLACGHDLRMYAYYATILASFL